VEEAKKDEEENPLTRWCQAALSTFGVKYEQEKEEYAKSGKAVDVRETTKLARQFQDFVKTFMFGLEYAHKDFGGCGQCSSKVCQ